ncbi:unnamed protein product [Caenorhabditis auriculariae]|uniref:Transmembrane protein 138 n=1 Tax=Caenorhabditis auriculariae TaxID=2777116 RepID=A0A8S1HBF1_9PELO|nr:unnamed protein product [Caenorhabditis auriculariae]
MASKYPLVLYAQMLMLTMDMIFNALSVLLFGRNTALLLIYMSVIFLLGKKFLYQPSDRRTFDHAPAWAKVPQLVGCWFRVSPLAFLNSCLPVFPCVKQLTSQTGRLQDTLSVMCLIVLFVSFSSTFVFQVGLIYQILFTYLPSIISSVLYIILSISTHYFSLSARWLDADKDIWTVSMVALYVGHKFWAAIYYSSYKRAALHLSDPKYNVDSEWLRQKFRLKFNIAQNNAEQPQEQPVPTPAAPAEQSSKND